MLDRHTSQLAALDKQVAAAFPAHVVIRETLKDDDSYTWHIDPQNPAGVSARIHMRGWALLNKTPSGRSAEEVMKIEIKWVLAEMPVGVSDADLPIALITESGSFYLATPAIRRFVNIHDAEVREAVRSQQASGRFASSSTLGAWFFGYVEGRMTP